MALISQRLPARTPAVALTSFPGAVRVKPLPHVEMSPPGEGWKRFAEPAPNGALNAEILTAIRDGRLQGQSMEYTLGHFGHFVRNERGIVVDTVNPSPIRNADGNITGFAYPSFGVKERSVGGELQFQRVPDTRILTTGEKLLTAEGKLDRRDVVLHGQNVDSLEPVAVRNRSGLLLGFAYPNFQYKKASNGNETQYLRIPESRTLTFRGQPVGEDGVFPG